MGGHRVRFVAVVFTAACIAAAHSSMLARMARRIPGIPCSQNDLTNLMGKCMVHFTRGHGLPVLRQLRKSMTCDTSVINCRAVMETRVCIARMPASELSSACKPHINRVSDYQLGIFDIPCRVQHLKAKCMGFFERHGLVNF